MSRSTMNPATPRSDETIGAAADSGDLRKRIVRRIVRVGRACASDLANEIGVPVSPARVEKELVALSKEGVLKPLHDPKDPRAYRASEGRTIYQLAR